MGESRPRLPALPLDAALAAGRRERAPTISPDLGAKRKLVPRIFDTAGRRPPEGIAAAAAALARGQLVAMPTETVYGLAADADQRRSGRPHLPRQGTAALQSADRPRCLDWQRRERIAVVHAGGGAAGRSLLARTTDAGPAEAAGAPASPISSPPASTRSRSACRRIRWRRRCSTACGRPLAAPSANRSGHVSPTTAAHVAADLGEAVERHPRRRADAESASKSTIVGWSDDVPSCSAPAAVSRARSRRCSAAAAPRAGQRGDRRGARHARLALRAGARRSGSSATTCGPGEALLAFGLTLPPGREASVATVNLSEAGRPCARPPPGSSPRSAHSIGKADGDRGDADPGRGARRGDQRPPAPRRRAALVAPRLPRRARCSASRRATSSSAPRARHRRPPAARCGGDQEVAAAAAGLRQALALEAQSRPPLDFGGTVSVTGPSRVGTRTLAPSTASSRVTADVAAERVALDPEERVRHELDGDQGVAGGPPSAPGRPCPLRRIVWPERVPGEWRPPWCARSAARRGPSRRVTSCSSVTATVAATSSPRAACGARARARRRGRSRRGCRSGCRRPPKGSPRRRRSTSGTCARRPAGSAGAASATEPRARAAGKALPETRLAVRADLAAVELLALLLVADDLVGGVRLVEALLRLAGRTCSCRGGASWRACGRPLDFGLACRLADTEHLVGIAHG